MPKWLTPDVLNFEWANRKDSSVAHRNGTYLTVQPPTGHLLLLTLRIPKPYPPKHKFCFFKHNKTELPRLNTISSRLDQQQHCTRISIRYWFGISSELPNFRRVRSCTVFSSDCQVIFLRLLHNPYIIPFCMKIRSLSVDHRLRCWSSTRVIN